MNHKEIAILSVITFITVIAWIIFGVYHVRKTSVVTSVQLKEVAPLTPTFDNDIIRKLSTREE